MEKDLLKTNKETKTVVQFLTEEERVAQQEYDFTVRERGYRADPMNVLLFRMKSPVT